MANLAPMGMNAVVLVPQNYALRISNFRFTDTDGDALKAVVITTLPTSGTLFFDANGSLGGMRTAVTAGQVITAADIAAGKLTFVAGPDGADASFTFQVQDDGGTADGGVDTDASPNTLTLDVQGAAPIAPTFGSVIDLTGLAATNGFKIQGDADGDFAGYSVSGAGDINGDGFADILVGADRNDSGGSNAGAAYVIFGKASGFGPIDLATLQSTDGFKIQGDLAGDYAGRNVSAAGDVNGDGFADILVGALGNDSGGSSAGAAYVIFGKAGGFGPIDLTALAPTDGFKIQGDLGGDSAGRSVSGAGDVNGDGLADILVGADGNDGGGNNAGAAYVVFGKANGLGTVDLTALAPADGFRILGDAASDGVGRSVSGAGDVNGDGFADILVGAYGNDTGGMDAGAAYVVYGKANGFGTVDLMALAPADGFKVQGDAAGDRAGVSVSAAGDVNGDGFADILVGAFLNDAGGSIAGAAYVIFGKAGGLGPVDLTSLAPADGFSIQGDAADDRAGVSVSAAGDVNGDGFADILIGANGSDSGGVNSGAAYLLFGKAGGFGPVDLTGLAATDGFRIQGDVTSDYAGNSVSAAGDVNGDGFADILVGAHRNDSGGTDAGAAYVIFGRANVPINTAPAGTDAIVAVPQNYALRVANFGFSDADGDAFQAVVIASLPTSGTLFFDANGSLGGMRTAVTAGQVITVADITAGKLTFVAAPDAADASFTFQVQDDGGTADGGVDTDASANTLTFDVQQAGPVDRTFGSVIDLTDLTTTNGFKILGDTVRDYAGISVSGAGDVNGDGFADILVGAYTNGSGGVDAGAAYVIFGKAGGVGTIDLALLAPSDGFQIVGEAGGDLAGRSVSGAGDVNGDGFADVVVGAFFNFDYSNPNSTERTGAAYVIFGKAGERGSVSLAGLAATDGFKIQGEANADRAGRSVSGAGDVNGDGFADILVGAYANGSGGVDAGAAYVIFGKAGGVGTVDLTGLAAADGFKIQGDRQRDAAGRSVSAAGDVNGDGFADILVGANGNDSGGTEAGAAYVIFGKAGVFTTVDLTDLAPTAGVKIQGDNTNDRAGVSVSAAGDVNGDGFADILIGAYGNDGGGYDAGAAYVIFGKASGFGSLDLTTLTAADGFKIQGEAVNDRVYSVSGAGDVNGDGFADILVGATGNDSGGTDAGAAYVIFGKAGGFGTVDLAGLTAASGFKILGEDGSDYAGRSVSAAGDVNGDGFSDILIGAPGNDIGGYNAGAAYVIYGRSNIPLVTVVDDVASTPETTAVEDNVLVNDTSSDSSSVTVASVNGDSAAVGRQITLASGALVTLNRDGSYRYDPNGKFNTLVSAEKAAATGATNGSATDSFTYTATDGGTATVTVTINGVDNAGDRLAGSAGADTITGTPNNDVFLVTQGGDDDLSGFGGLDTFVFGGTFTGGDRVDGGAGNDVLALQGDYSAGVTFGAGVRDIGSVSLYSGGNNQFGLGSASLYDYNLTTVDGNVAAGQQLRINGANLQAGEDLTFNGAAETDGVFQVLGGLGVDTVTGGSGNDVVVFGPGGRFAAGDTVTGGAGYDVVYLKGNYTADLTAPGFAGAFAGVESIGLLSATNTEFVSAGGATEFDYSITWADALLGAGQTITVNGSRLTAEESMSFNGSAETNGIFRLFGGGGNDVLTGGTGNDLIFGGARGDTLTGGAGNDVFRYQSVEESNSTERDGIQDFNLGDLIDLSRIDAISGTAENDAFSFIGSAAFSGTAGELRFENISSGGPVWEIEGDIDGDGVSDFEVVLIINPPDPITASDFLL